jgi:hypothetical protein
MPRYIISVDPGKATGVAYFKHEVGSDPEILHSSEVQADEFAPWLRGVVDDALARTALTDHQIVFICERFIINAQTVRNSQAPYSLEQIGVMKQVMRDYNFKDSDIKWQSPADAKAMFPNPALKKVGLWHKGGEGHALDAIRHGALYLVKNGWKPLKLLS